MDSNYVLGPNGELYHWGIKGMKWGVRRYQNKDGSLTKAGRKRYAEEEAKLKAREKEIKGRERVAAKKAKLDAKKAELDAREAALKGKKKPSAEEKPSNKPKTMRDMTDDELREYTSRMQLEKQYIEAQRSLSAAMPQKVSKGKQFMDGLMKDVIVPAAKSAGKDYVEKVMKKKLGLDKRDPDSLKELENEYKKLEWKTKYNDLKKAGTLKEPKEPKTPSWDDLTKEQTWIKNQQSTHEAQDKYEEWLKEREKRREQGGS